MASIDPIKKFVKERDAMLLKRDVTELRKFVNERTDIYGADFIERLNAASDEIVEITLHKMIANVTSLPLDFVTDSVKWLLERGYSPYI